MAIMIEILKSLIPAITGCSPPEELEFCGCWWVIYSQGHNGEETSCQFCLISIINSQLELGTLGQATETFASLHREKLDGVGPVDNRPFTN